MKFWAGSVQKKKKAVYMESFFLNGVDVHSETDKGTPCPRELHIFDKEGAISDIREHGPVTGKRHQHVRDSRAG